MGNGTVKSFSCNLYMTQMEKLAYDLVTFFTGKVYIYIYIYII